MSVVSIDKQNRIILRKLPIGYLTDERSAVADIDALASFANRWLMQRGYRVEWRAGIIRELQQQAQWLPTEEETNVKVYQLDGTHQRGKRFLGYDLTIRRYGKIDPAEYRCVFEGNLGTQNLEEIFTLLNKDELPADYLGSSLSISDVVELIQNGKSSYHFVDKYGFQEIPFQPQQRLTETDNMSLSQ